MHKVLRNSPPKRLITKHNSFINKLLKQPNIAHKWDKLNRKTKKDVIESLNEMYNDCCCY